MRTIVTHTFTEEERQQMLLVITKIRQELEDIDLNREGIDFNRLKVFVALAENLVGTKLGSNIDSELPSTWDNIIVTLKEIYVQIQMYFVNPELYQQINWKRWKELNTKGRQLFVDDFQGTFLTRQQILDPTEFITDPKYIQTQINTFIADHEFIQTKSQLTIFNFLQLTPESTPTFTPQALDTLHVYNESIGLQDNIFQVDAAAQAELADMFSQQFYISKATEAIKEEDTEALKSLTDNMEYKSKLRGRAQLLPTFVKEHSIGSITDFYLLKYLSRYRTSGAEKFSLDSSTIAEYLQTFQNEPDLLFLGIQNMLGEEHFDRFMEQYSTEFQDTTDFESIIKMYAPRLEEYIKKELKLMI